MFGALGGALAQQPGMAGAEVWPFLFRQWQS